MTFNALAGVPLEAEIWGRVPPRVRRVFARYKSPSRRCAASYARDRGKRLGRGRFAVPGRGAFSVGTRQRWRKPGRVRICVWLARSARSRVIARTQVVELHNGLGGLSLAPAGSFADPRGLAWGAASTQPFSASRETVHRPAPRTVCPDPRRDDFAADVGFERIFKLGGFASDTSGSTCPADMTWQVRLAAGPRSRGLHSLAYAADELAPGAAAPIKHLGDCVMGAAMSRTVSETEAYIRAVGCVPGEVIARRRTPLAGHPLPGEVYALELHGARAELAPPGTVIDIIVQPGG